MSRWSRSRPTQSCQLTRRSPLIGRRRPRGDSYHGHRRTSSRSGCHGLFDVKAPRKMLRKPPGAITMDTRGGGRGEGRGGAEFRGSGSVKAVGSGSALNTLRSERRTAALAPIAQRINPGIPVRSECELCPRRLGGGVGGFPSIYKIRGGPGGSSRRPRRSAAEDAYCGRGRGVRV